MQAQEVPPSAEATVLGDPQQQAGAEHDVGAEDGHKKKSVIKKMKDKAKKLKTKMSPRSHSATGDHDDAGDHDDDSSSASGSDEEESESDPHQQELGKETGEERDVVVKPGLKGEAFEAVPDESLGQLSLGDEPPARKLQEEVPSAPGQVSAGVSPYLASHALGQSTEASRGIPVEEGKNAEEEDLLVTPAASDKGAGPMDYELPSDVSKTSDNTAAWYTPPPVESALDAGQQKPLKDHIFEGATAAKDGVAATAVSGAGALGLRSTADGENMEDKDRVASEAPKTTLDQAKEKVLGSSEKPEGKSVELGENKPSFTERASGTVTGLKDTIASKLGYGSSKKLTRESDAPMDTTPNTQVDAQIPENKSVLQKMQETATGATTAVTSKLGYGEKESGDKSSSEAVADEVNPGDNKTYTQKAREAAFGAKNAVATKLGYGGTSPKDVASATEGDNKSYLQKAQETAVGAKDAVASKLGYANRDIPAAATESAYADEQNVPASTAARFHPGEEDKALSQLITEKMSTGAATVKDTLMKPFGSKSGPPTPITTPPPSSAAAVEADPVHSTVKELDVPLPQEEKPGMFGKVTGAVSSLLGTSPSGSKSGPPTPITTPPPSSAAAVEADPVHSTVTKLDVPLQEEKPGMFGKVTGAVSSLLGTSPSGKKKADEVVGKGMEDPQTQAPGVGDVKIH